MALIYVSSSYQDLKEYRRRAAETIRKIGHVPVGMERDSASERRPLDACLADVRRCQAYLGILGFRYGSSPPGEARSYTELEYEEAGRRQNPCRLMFVARSDVTGIPPQFVDRDPGRVEAFRTLVEAHHSVAHFSTPGGFAEEVEAAVLNELGRGRDVPPLLPWLCDQSEQEEAIRASIASWSPRRPLVLIAHGDTREHHRRFIDRLRQRTLPPLLGLEGKTVVKDHELPWPETRTAQARPSRWFADQLAGLVGHKAGAAPPLEEVLAGLAQSRRTPLLLWSVAVADEWTSDPREVISRFVACWRDCPDFPSERPLVVCLAIEYRPGEATGLMRWLRWRAPMADRLRGLERSLGGAEPQVTRVALPRLGQDAVNRQHVMNWIANEVKRLGDSYAFDEDILLGKIDELFADHERLHGTHLIPMKALGEGLKRALEASLLTSRKGGGLFA